MTLSIIINERKLQRHLNLGLKKGDFARPEGERRELHITEQKF